ncbi:hypothetical protein AN477_03150 [Alicyclobacillus ferrooxydans]|uniref:Amidase domain-containing protein n=2 Tax=Alicyclobacillus ferrooxydans TaxID=471514 RepID=A0A0N8PPW0_9BACL|nr:hypothetical protein AN477_03150 [Alicyclobacillus ferrooxydans]
MWDLTTTLDALNTKQLSSAELVQNLFERIDKYDPGLSAYIWVNRDEAMARADQFDNRRANGEVLPPLAGIPICVKDLFDIEGTPSTYGGRHYRSHIAKDTATAVQRLLQAGVIVIGKTNLHEYAYGTTTENPHYGNARNPWNRGKIAGGSSGGTSVAITAGLAFAGLGTDTGGSVRIPAALTGHAGLKPTYGLVSKFGVFPLANSLDHVGPMGKTVTDLALLLDAMAGFDPLDETSARTMSQSYVPQTVSHDKPLAGVRLGVPRQFFFDRCHSNVLQVISQALHQLERAGATLIELDIPLIHDVPQNQTIVISSEALDVHRSLLKEATLYGDDVRRRLEAGAEVSGADLVSAYRFRRQFKAGLREVFSKPVDLLVTPTTPLTATDIGQFKAHIKAHEVNVRAHLTRYTNPWNLSGLPALTVPCGTAADGLPVGLQLVGPAFAERKLLNLGAKVESVLPWTAVAPDYR